jgi:hypothetical protein
MANAGSGKRILILSPQPWDHHLISKHHYARAFAQHHEVVFVTPPITSITKLPGYHTVQPDETLPNLRVLTLQVMYPNRFRFYFPRTFRWVNAWRLRRWLKRNFTGIDLLIDFGCYNQVNDLTKFAARKKVFFPVDDVETLKSESRGADLMLTVSTSIQKKFTDAGLDMKFMNHGLADDFVKRARKRLTHGAPVSHPGTKRLRVGYSGNIFIPFLDRAVLKRCLEEHRDLEFHFFGSSQPLNTNDQAWFDFLARQENVILEGQKETAALAEALEGMDALLVCYKPDYKNYHGENTHKMLEYLSTGRLVISTFISYYQQFDFLMMAEKNNNAMLVDMLERMKMSPALREDAVRSQRQTIYALENSYAQRCRDVMQGI